MKYIVGPSKVIDSDIEDKRDLMLMFLQIGELEENHETASRGHEILG